MIKKKLDIIQVDVAEDDNGVVTYQGATLFYSREVWDNGENIGKLPHETASASVEEAQKILGGSTGAYVQKLAETEQILADERADWAEEKVALEARIAQLENDNTTMSNELTAASERLSTIQQLSTPAS